MWIQDSGHPGVTRIQQPSCYPGFQKTTSSIFFRAFLCWASKLHRTQFALQEAILVLCRVIQRFTIHMHRGKQDDMRPQFVGVLQPVGFKAISVPRQQ